MTRYHVLEIAWRVNFLLVSSSISLFLMTRPPCDSTKVLLAWVHVQHSVVWLAQLCVGMWFGIMTHILSESMTLVPQG